MTATEPAGPTFEEQQVAYKSWRVDFDKLSNDLDAANAVWKTVFDGMAKGEVSRYTAYEALSRTHGYLKEIKRQAYALKPPANLTEEHRKALGAVAVALGMAAYHREQAFKYALEVLDEMKPSTVQKARHEMELANRFVVDAVAFAVGVEAALGPLESQQKKE